MNKLKKFKVFYFLGGDGIEYTEQVEDGYYFGSFYVFKFPAMTKEQLEMATKYTDVRFYQ